MNPYFESYYWDQGRPEGRGKLANAGKQSYRIVEDPYHRRISVERYRGGRFDVAVYDSNLLDFRLLNPQSQVAWNREILNEEAEKTLAAIRNVDDRVIYLEESHYADGHCVESRILSPTKEAVALQKIYFEDSFSGVILFDVEQRPVMWKSYQVGPDGEFTHLIEEAWNMATTPPPLS